MKTTEFDCKFDCELKLQSSDHKFDGKFWQYFDILEYFDNKINQWYDILDLLVVLFSFMDTKCTIYAKFFFSVETFDEIPVLVLVTSSPSWEAPNIHVVLEDLVF